MPATVAWSMPCAWVISGMAVLLLPGSWIASEYLAAFSLMVAGVLVAADLRLRGGWVLAAGVGLGAFHGVLNGSAMRDAGLRTGLLQMLGIGVPVIGAVFYPIAVLDMADIVKRPWVRIAARVLGSWIAAAGLLQLGWSLRSTP
jgi:hydrogenase/urease accessory protein HupE